MINPTGAQVQDCDCRLLISIRLFIVSIKADTHEGFCSRVMSQGHAAAPPCVPTIFMGIIHPREQNFSPLRKLLHDINPVKYLGARSQGKFSKLEIAPSCVLTRAK